MPTTSLRFHFRLATLLTVVAAIALVLSTTTLVSVRDSGVSGDWLWNGRAYVGLVREHYGNRSAFVVAGFNGK